MPLTIGSNIASLQAQRRLGRHSDQLELTLERLASGQRINRASDDAAGLAVHASLRVQSRLQTQAMKNINDGLSLLNIGMSAFTSQTEILVRLTELAEQAGNGVYSQQQRLGMNREYQALIDEFDRIAKTTSFNGVYLLDPDSGSAVREVLLQAGVSGDANSLLSISFSASGSASGTAGLKTDIDSNSGVNFADAFALRGGLTSSNIWQNSGYSIAYASLTDSQGQQREVWIAIGNPRGNLGYVPPNDPPLSTIDYGVYSYLRTGWASVGGELMETSGSLPGSLNGTLTFNDTGATASLTLDLSEMTFAALDWNNSVRKSSIEFTGIETVERARDALDTVRNRLEDLAQQQSTLGALQSRLFSALQVAAIEHETKAAAAARIGDVDFADESSRFVSSQIRQQAGAAVLAQANLMPSLALTLLK